jgi:hypothetical protein
MAKVVGTIQLTAQPGFPQLTGADGDETITMKYRCSDADLASLPDYGDMFSDSNYPYFTTFTGNIVETRNIARDKSGEFYDVTLTYKRAEGSGGTTPSGPVIEEWDYETQDFDVPIEQHPNYLACWNYRFICIQGELEDVNLWSTAENTELDEDQSKKYAWIKPGDKVPEGWYEVHEVYKPGVESYRTGVTTVNCMKRCTDLKKLIASAANDYKIQTPYSGNKPMTFGKEGEWLRGGSKLKKEGRYWVLTVSWLNRDEWDSDIYEAAT